MHPIGLAALKTSPHALPAPPPRTTRETTTLADTPAFAAGCPMLAGPSPLAAVPARPPGAFPPPHPHVAGIAPAPTPTPTSWLDPTIQLFATEPDPVTPLAWLTSMRGEAAGKLIAQAAGKSTPLVAIMSERLSSSTTPPPSTLMMWADSLRPRDTADALARLEEVCEAALTPPPAPRDGHQHGHGALWRPRRRRGAAGLPAERSATRLRPPRRTRAGAAPGPG